MITQSSCPYETGTVSNAAHQRSSSESLICPSDQDFRLSALVRDAKEASTNNPTQKREVTGSTLVPTTGTLQFRAYFNWS